MLTAIAVAALVLGSGAAPTEPPAPPFEGDPPLEQDAPRILSGERQARLLAERVELEASRPPTLAPLLLTGGGVLLALSGVGLVWAAVVTGIYYAFSFAIGSVALLTIGIVLFVAAVPLTTVGALKLHRARIERRRIDQRLEQLDQEEAGIPTVVTF